jgi:hypothetical protein
MLTNHFSCNLTEFNIWGQPATNILLLLLFDRMHNNWTVLSLASVVDWQASATALMMRVAKVPECRAPAVQEARLIPVSNFTCWKAAVWVYWIGQEAGYWSRVRTKKKDWLLTGGAMSRRDLIGLPLATRNCLRQGIQVPTLSLRRLAYEKLFLKPADNHNNHQMLNTEDMYVDNFMFRRNSWNQNDVKY